MSTDDSTSTAENGVVALREAAQAARAMHDPGAPEWAEWADWLDARTDRLEALEAWRSVHYQVIRSHGCDDPAPECACGSPATPHLPPAKALGDSDV